MVAVSDGLLRSGLSPTLFGIPKKTCLYIHLTPLRRSAGARLNAGIAVALDQLPSGIAADFTGRFRRWPFVVAGRYGERLVDFRWSRRELRFPYPTARPLFERRVVRRSAKKSFP